MIEIKYETKTVREGRQFLISITGHADYAEKGSDIVCAGVSALTIALVHTLDDLQDEGKVENIMNISDGEAEIECLSMIFTDIIEVESAFNTVLRGFRHIEKEYPKNVKVT